MKMEEAYEKSLQMIRVLNVKTEKQYNKLVQTYLILNLQSMKYITEKKKFKEIVELAMEVE